MPGRFASTRERMGLRKRLRAPRLLGRRSPSGHVPPDSWLLRSSGMRTKALLGKDIQLLSCFKVRSSMSAQEQYYSPELMSELGASAPVKLTRCEKRRCSKRTHLLRVDRYASARIK